MDALSDLIRMIRLSVSIFHNAMICGDWKLEAAASRATCFHMVTIGGCKLNVPNHLCAELEAGDLVIFPREIPHSISPLTPQEGEQQHIPYQLFSTKGIGTGMLCGALRFQHAASEKLLEALPPIIIIQYKKNRNWLTPMVELILEESCKSGSASDVILDRLCEILFIQTLRQHLQQNPEKLGMLKLYSHPRIAKAINSMHQTPENNWTLDSIAKCAAQSRTQFAKTFKALSNWTPIQYLTWWRMQLAWMYLNEGMPIFAVAAKIGYQSESSFLRAFKKEFSLTAGEVKRMAKARG